MAASKVAYLSHGAVIFVVIFIDVEKEHPIPANSTQLNIIHDVCIIHDGCWYVCRTANKGVLGANHLQKLIHRWVRTFKVLDFVCVLFVCNGHMFFSGWIHATTYTLFIIYSSIHTHTHGCIQTQQKYRQKHTLTHTNKKDLLIHTNT